MSTNIFLAPILDRLRARPSAIFGAFRVEGAWQTVSNEAFLERTFAFAKTLRANGVEAGDLVFLIIDHGVDAIAAFIGAMIASAVPSFLPYPNVKQDDAAYWAQHANIFKAAAPRAIVCFDALEADLRANVEALPIAVILLSETRRRLAPEADWRLPPSSAVGLLQHSSGTTGLKKGVALSYEAITSQLASYGKALRLEGVERPVIVSWLPLYHDMGLITALLLPVWAGIKLVSIDPFEWVADPAIQLEAIQAFGGTHMWLPNFAFVHLARRAPARQQWNLSTLHAAISCSEPCKPAAFNHFHQRFAASGVERRALQTCYAMAETVFAISQSLPDAVVPEITVDRAAIELEGIVNLVPAKSPASLSLLSNGPCISGGEVRVMQGSASLPEDRVGEICVRADFMFSGYFNNPAATEAAFLDGWYRTGDLGFVHDGQIYIVGRIKDVIIVNGKNIFAHDVEASIGKVSGIKGGRAVAFGHYSERYGSEQLVVVAEAEDAEADPDELARLINHAVFAEVGIPCSDVRVVAPGWLVKTTSGKISRAANAAKYGEMVRQSPA